MVGLRRRFFLRCGRLWLVAEPFKRMSKACKAPLLAVYGPGMLASSLGPVTGVAYEVLQSFRSFSEV